MAETLTLSQRTAVEDRGGKLLVSAAAGSGKTKVLVDRLLKYIMDPVDPSNIDEFLIITYTKAAAAELRGKIAAKLSEHIAADPGNRHLQRQLQRLYLTKISTVHAFCADVLREHAYRLDISGDFRVADENECIQLRDRAMKNVLERAYSEIDSQPHLQSFVDTQGLGRTDAMVPEIIEKVFDSACCHLDPDAWLQSCIDNANVSEVTDASQTVWGRALMDDLFAYLDRQITSMKRCAQAIENISGLEKPGALLRDTVNQLEHLRSSTTWDQIVERKAIDFGRFTIPKKADDPSVTGPVKAVRNACKDGLTKKLRSFCDPSAQVIADVAQASEAAKGLIRLVREFAKEFDRLKRMRHVLDFSDLEQMTLTLLLGKHRSAPTIAARELGERFREIMVDEYQDSNVVQDRIFSALTEKRNNLFMVGDVKQSIYQFRLADPEIFIDKYNAYDLAEDARPGQGRKVLLSSNFRSGGAVLDAVNAVFQICMTPEVGGLNYGHEEMLREGIPHGTLHEPEVELHCIQVAEDTYQEEAAFVAEKILSLTDGTHYVRSGEVLRPITFDDVVILLRSPGSVGAEYQALLESRGIPCSTGGSTDLLLTQEVGTLRAILQTISNPRQDIPLLAALASPVWGFTADDLAAIRGSTPYGCFYEAVCASKDPKCVSFLEELKDLRETARMHALPELLERIFYLTRLDSVYSAMDDGAFRNGNLQAFYDLAVGFAAMGNPDLDQFLNHLESMEDRGLTVSQEQPGGCVRIMSIHKSKGLEFPVVFLCGLSRRFNRESAHEQVLCHKAMGLGLACVDTKNRVRYPTISKRAISARISADSLSEELRILYVAMTRARDRLLMTYASDTLKSDLSDLVLRMDISGKELMTSQVACPGEWVLYTALQRTEAGELFRIAGSSPQETSSGAYPWKIAVHDAVEAQGLLLEEEESAEPACSQLLDSLEEVLSFRYCHTAATQTPSKQTATQRKGRQKDQEAAENTPVPSHIWRSWRKPSFLEQKICGTQYGTAVHTVLQHIRYEACADISCVKAEVDRLTQEGFLSEDQAQMIPCDAIAHFFDTELGRKLRVAKNVLREFKFSILDDASQYGEDLQDERVLLQGVVDCAVIEDDGITVVDFKTDKITDEILDSVAARYAPQVQTYADALSRIFDRKIKGKALWFFHLNRLVWLP